MLATPSPGRPPLGRVIVATKLDKLKPSEQKSALAEIHAEELRAVGFSSELAETTRTLWRALERAAGLEPAQ
jgi:hypothetical protein